MNVVDVSAASKHTVGIKCVILRCFGKVPMGIDRGKADRTIFGMLLKLQGVKRINTDVTIYVRRLRNTQYYGISFGILRKGANEIASILKTREFEEKESEELAEIIKNHIISRFGDGVFGERLFGNADEGQLYAMTNKVNFYKKIKNLPL